jgi:hypothetical protein
MSDDYAETKDAIERAGFVTCDCGQIRFGFCEVCGARSDSPYLEAFDLTKRVAEIVKAIAWDEMSDAELNAIEVKLRDERSRRGAARIKGRAA